MLLFQSVRCLSRVFSDTHVTDHQRSGSSRSVRRLPGRNLGWSGKFVINTLSPSFNSTCLYCIFFVVFIVILSASPVGIEPTASGTANQRSIL